MRCQFEESIRFLECWSNRPNRKTHINKDEDVALSMGKEDSYVFCGGDYQLRPQEWCMLVFWRQRPQQHCGVSLGLLVVGSTLRDPDQTKKLPLKQRRWHVWGKGIPF